MKNKKIVLLIIIFLLIILPSSVNAIPLCTAKQKNKLETEALKVKIRYRLVKIEDNEDAYYEITIVGLSENLYVNYDGRIFNGIGEDHNITIDGLFEPNKEFLFQVYSKDKGEACGNAYLLTRKIKTPYYNKYSALDECVEYEEFPLCSQTYTGEIKDYEDFKNQLKDFIKSTKEEIELYHDDRNIFEKIIDVYTDNIEISVAFTILLILTIIAYIVRKVYRWAIRQKIKL